VLWIGAHIVLLRCVNEMPMRFLLATLLNLLPALGLAQSSAAPVSATIQPQQTPIQWWSGSPQTPVAAAPAGTNSLGAEMPLWATPDGRILAIVAMGNNNGAPVMPQSPQVSSAADWRLVDVTSYVNGGLALRMTDNASAYANFGRGIMLAPLFQTPECGQSSLFGLGGACIAPATVGNKGAANLGIEFGASDVTLDLNYGLSWLRLSDAAAAHQSWDLFSSDPSMPTLMMPGFALANTQSTSFGAQSRWRLDDTQSVDMGAALSRIQFEIPGMPLSSMNLNQAALSLGMRRGDFSGLIVGRVLGPNDAISGGQHWSSIDLGISWRAPWRGVFSIGAQNVWSSGYLPTLSEPAAAREIDPSQARVPYVQYHQDL
jgi:hypothetical protein